MLSNRSNLPSCQVSMFNTSPISRKCDITVRTCKLLRHIIPLEEIDRNCFTALIRVIFRVNAHFTHLLGKRCWNLHYPTVTKTILERQYPGKPTLKVAFGNGNGAIFENSSKLRASLFVTSRWPRSSGQTNYQVHHPPPPPRAAHTDDSHDSLARWLAVCQDPSRLV